MGKWYEQRYVNRRDWILENLELLGLDAQETIIVLLIDYLNTYDESVSLDSLHKKSGMSEEEVDRVVSVLCAKKYLEIRASNQKVIFALDGLFETKVSRDISVLDQSLFDIFESTFGRTLSSKEMEKISDWNRTIDRTLIINALREASAYQKKNLPYIESILNEWRKKGYTAQDIKEGKQYER